MKSSPENSPTTILRITAEDTYPVRQPVLRPGRPAQECIFEGDTLSTTLHLGTYIDDRLVGVASYMKNPHRYFDHQVQFQLRGMAVLPEFRNKKLGEQLLLQGEKELLKEHRELLLWFNARETAVDFYRRYGYQTKGEIFMIPNVCPHIVMYRQLS